MALPCSHEIKLICFPVAPNENLSVCFLVLPKEILQFIQPMGHTGYPDSTNAVGDNQRRHKNKAAKKEYEGCSKLT